MCNLASEAYSLAESTSSELTELDGALRTLESALDDGLSSVKACGLERHRFILDQLEAIWNANKTQLEVIVNLQEQIKLLSRQLELLEGKNHDGE